MITIEQIREKIKNEIKNSEFSQTQIAKLLGIKQPTVNQYITGKALPALDTLANFCVEFDIDANDLLCITEEKGSKEKFTYNDKNKKY